MRNAELRRRWKKAGRSYRSLAEEIGCDDMSVLRAVTGVTKCPRPEIAHAIAGVIGEPASTIWPACDLPSKRGATRQAA